VTVPMLREPGLEAMGEADRLGRAGATVLEPRIQSASAGTGGGTGTSSTSSLGLIAGYSVIFASTSFI
jgi:hypothetical protein